VDTCDPEREWRHFVVHVHTSSKWVEATSIHPQERVKTQIMSVNVRHANKGEVNGSYKQEYGAQSYDVVPVTSNLRKNWRQLFKDGHFSQMQWGTDPLTLPKGEDQNNIVKGTYTQLQRVIRLGESLFKSHPVAQAWTIADHIHHFNNQLTNVPLNRTPLRGYRPSLAFEIVAFRKKIVAGADAGGSQASVTEWTEPNWSELKLDAPNQAPWPFKILFVGANGSEHADLSLKEESGKMESAFREEFNRCDDKDKPSLKQIPYSTWKDVMDQVGQEYPSILHFGCDARANGVELYGKTVQPQQMIPEIKAHNEFARERGKGRSMLLL